MLSIELQAPNRFIANQSPINDSKAADLRLDIGDVCIYFATGLRRASLNGDERLKGLFPPFVRQKSPVVVAAFPRA